MKYFLVTFVHDYEGTFGDLDEYDTQEAALAAAVVFEEAHKKRPTIGYDYKILEGRVLSEGP